MDAGSYVWTDEEQRAGVALFRKIVTTQDAGKYLPIEVFEAKLSAGKNISTEMVVFDREGRVYLIERPGLDTSPHEPFPGLWHTPGVTHMGNERFESTVARLEKREFGGELENVTFVDTAEAADPPRGLYLLLIHYAFVYAELANPRGRFFRQDDIPWDQLVTSHREVILPKALKAYRDCR